MAEKVPPGRIPFSSFTGQSTDDSVHFNCIFNALLQRSQRYFTLLNRANRPTWPKRFRHVAQLFHFLFFPLPPELLVPLGQLTWTEERNAAQDPGHLLLFLWKIADIPTPSTAKPSGPARVLASLVPYPRPCTTFIPQLVCFLMFPFYVALPIRLG